MRALNRRDLFMGLGSLYAGLISRRAAAALSAKIPPAPVARVAVVKDSYFGETLSDPYRWMENDKDPEWLPFLRGQNAHARAVLDAIPGRSQLLKRIAELSGDAASTRSAQRAGGQLFFEQRPVGADNFKLFVRHDGVDRVLIDPTQLSDANGHMSLDWWEPSPDGTHVVYGLSKDGSEDSVLHVLRVADGRDLPERIANTEAAHPQWLDDGSGRSSLPQSSTEWGGPTRCATSRSRTAMARSRNGARSPRNQVIGRSRASTAINTCAMAWRIPRCCSPPG